MLMFLMSKVRAAALPVITQSLSGWLLSPWIHMAGQLKNTIMVEWED